MLITFFISYIQVSAQESVSSIGEKPLVIPRASWWANSQYNSLSDIYWQDILTARKKYVPAEKPQADIDYAKKKTQEIEDYLYGNFLDQFTSVETVKTKNNWEHTYAWPIKYTNYVDSIIIHHTHSEYENSLEWMNAIHRYHSLNRQWWDIGYNYIIWYDWEIFEGREGWDYAVWAHSKYNNFATVWIAVMWNYDSEWVNNKQYTSLEKLIQYLVVKYWIDLSNKRYYHRTCSWSACDTFHIETYLDSVLIWHRDATHTTCPWEKLYEQIQKIRTDNLEFSSWLSSVYRGKNSLEYTNTSNATNTSQIQRILTLVQNFSSEEKQEIITLIDKKRVETTNTETLKKLQIIRFAVILSLD